jgi:hypothetical protein
MSFCATTAILASVLMIQSYVCASQGEIAEIHRKRRALTLQADYTRSQIYLRKAVGEVGLIRAHEKW